MAKASIFCPYCHSESVISRGKSWYCKDCNKFWRKKYKERRIWNKNLTKEDDKRIANYGEKISKTKQSNIKYKKIELKNLPEPKIKISPQKMEELYKGRSQNDIAKILNVCQGAISAFMKRHGIKTKPKHIWSNRDPKKQEKINKKISKALKGNTNWRYSHQFPNNDELTLIRFFARNRLPFEYVGDGNFLIDGKCPDFIWKEKKLIVEFFGDIWHRSTDEPSRIKFFEKRGWRCLVIWGREIRKAGWEKFLLKKINNWLEKH